MRRFLGHCLPLRLTGFGATPVHPADEDESDDSDKRPEVSAPAFGGLDPNAIASSKARVATVDTREFTLIMGAVILVNSWTVGLETEADDDGATILATFNTVFLLAYIGELACRFLTHGPGSLRDRLTALDTAIILAAFVERMIANSGLTRALPLFRLLRTFRMLKDTNSFSGERELRILVCTARNTVVLLGWLCVIVFLVVLANSSVAKYAIGDSAEWVGVMDPLVSQEPFVPFDNREYFGSSFRSFLTLMQIATRSQWADVARRAVLVYPASCVFFLFFIFVAGYSLAASAIACTVQAALHFVAGEEELREATEREGRRYIGDQVLMLLRRADRDGDGVVQAEEFDAALRRTELPALLRELNATDFDGARFIRAFDKLGNKRVTNEEIVEGLIRMDEDIKTKDYVRLNLWARNCLLRASRLGDRVGSLSVKCHDLRVSLEKAIEAMEYFQGTKEMSELRFRAIQAIRSAPPGEAPKLAGWKPPKEPKYPPEDEATRFTNFASAVLGGHGPFAAREGASPTPPRASAKGSESVAAPPYVETIANVVRGRHAPERDKFDLIRDPKRDFMPGPSPSLKSLRELLQ